MAVVSKRFISNSSINHPLCICMMDDFFILSNFFVVADITNYRQINIMSFNYYTHAVAYYRKVMRERGRRKGKFIQ